MKSKKTSGRRCNHEGGWVKRKDGTYQGQIMFSGKRLYKYSHNLEDIKDWLSEMTFELRRGMAVTDSKTPLIEWLRHYTTTYCEGYCRPSTIENYNLYTEGHIAKSRISGVPIRQLTTDHVQIFFNNIKRLDGKGNLSQKTCRNILVFLKAALSQAKVCGLTYVNAAEGVRLKKPEPNKRPLLTEREVSNAINAAGNHAFAIGILIQATIGLRTSEVLALRHDSLIMIGDIPALKIEYAVKREPYKGIVSKGMPKTHWVLSVPKTEASKANVPIPPFLYNEIEKIISMQKEKARTSPVFISNAFLCGDPDTGEMITPDRYRAFWNKVKEQADLPKDAVLHCLRHYTASSLIRNGASHVAVARILRHAQNSTTLNFYSHENLAGAYSAILKNEIAVNTKNYRKDDCNVNL